MKSSVKYNSDLIIAREKIKQSQLNEKSAESDLLPQLGSTFSVKRSKSTLGTQDNFSGQLSISQLLFDWGKTSYNLEKAQRSTMFYKYSYVYNSASTRSDLRKAFINLLNYQEQLKLNSSIEASRKKQYELITLRYESGREHRGALLTAQADLSQATAAVQATIRNLGLAQQKLALEMGLDSWNELEATGNFIVQNYEAVDFEKIAKEHPNLLQYEWDRKSKESSLEAARAGELPYIYASLSYGLNDNQFFPQNDSWSMGINASYTIWDWGSLASQTGIAQSQYDQAVEYEKSVYKNVLYNLKEAWINLINARDNVDISKKYLEASDVRSQIADVQYSTGQIGYDNWILIINDNINMKKNYLSAEAGLLTAEAAWIMAKGGTLENEE
ncbi:MAG: TolC family protein [Candidatus Margulisbacteria bacterium]|nr:TolC family protein [Candidatus Margulisiibacteriota bacterium]